MSTGNATVAGVACKAQMSEHVEQIDAGSADNPNATMEGRKRWGGVCQPVEDGSPLLEAWRDRKTVTYEGPVARDNGRQQHVSGEVIITRIRGDRFDLKGTGPFEVIE